MAEELESNLRRDGIRKVRDDLTEFREIYFRSITGNDLNIFNLIKTVMQNSDQSRVKFNYNYFFCLLCKPLCKVSDTCTDFKDNVIRIQISSSYYPVQIACIDQKMLIKSASFYIIFFKKRTNQS